MNKTQEIKKKLIDEMEEYLGFYIPDYICEIRQDGSTGRYSIPLDISAMISSFLLLKKLSDTERNQFISYYISHLSLSQKISEVRAIAKIIKRKRNSRSLGRGLTVNERELKEFLEKNRISFKHHVLLNIPESLIEEYITAHPNKINELIEENKKNANLNNIISKMKKMKELDQIEKTALKYTLTQRFNHILNHFEDESLSDIEIEAIVDNQIKKIECYQQAFQKCVTMQDEINDELHQRISSLLQIKNYYNSDLPLDSLQDVIKKKLDKMETLKKQVIQVIRNFDMDSE